jgi:hypothetical protein
VDPQLELTKVELHAAKCAGGRDLPTNKPATADGFRALKQAHLGLCQSRGANGVDGSCRRAVVLEERVGRMVQAYKYT